MDNKSCNSSGGDADSTSATSSSSSGNRDMYLKHLNKISHKISKPIRKPPPPPLFDNNQNLQTRPQAQTQHAPPPGPPLQNLQPQPQQQPPVYNINKSDFRDVVQKLTGSPAHERISTPPPIQQPKAPSSRLQRIRPPPLAQITNRPPPFVNASNVVAGGGIGCGGGFVGCQRPVHAQPLSPLPPFPAVHAAAESPISAYMRFLQSSIASGSSGLSPLAPRWINVGPPQQQPPFPPQSFPLPQQQNIPPPPTASSSVLPPFPAFPSSPLPFGCLPSPKSPYGLLSPSLLLSPSGHLGFQQLPLSPTLPVPSPKWKGI
ncbi:VQ motif-containing protein 9 [Nicotiana tabacum]|uniref:VQ motif-containing protein 9 n=1 Tax=Nicotiana tabacum TaxID=4097 RepID=A0A1S3YMF4_TOBAC|nr:PREDICTED: VQ motif-containing protein 9 [Nicotiana tabacum]